MPLSSRLTLEMSDAEARGLWRFLCTREDELDNSLSALCKRLEAGLWDRLTIEEMAGTAPETRHG